MPPRPVGPAYLQNPEFLGYQKQATDLGIQMRDYMMNSPLYKQQQALEQSMSSRLGQPLTDPNGLGQIALMQQKPEFQQYMQQRQDLDRQLQAYSQNAPMYKQLMDVQGKMQAIASPYGGPDGVGQPGFAQPPMPPRPQPPMPQLPMPPLYYDANQNPLNPGGGMIGYDEGVYNADGTPLNPLVTGPRPIEPNFNNYGFDPALVDYLNKQKQMSTYDAGVSYQYDPATQTFTGATMAGPVKKTLQEMQAQQQTQGQPPGFAQPYMQGLGAAAASRAAPKTNPMTGLGAFAANPNIAAANPFAGLGVTAGAQQARQNVQPPYNPGLDDSRMGDTFKGSGASNVPFGQTVGQLLGGPLFGMGQTLGQPQTQQSPYAQQQSANLMQQPQNSNLMQNADQVGQGVYGSFVGQQKPQQQTMQQNNPAMQNSVAPPMQAGFNFFDQGPTQSQGQNNTGGGTTGGGLF
jgi:hypothetical protein